MANESVQVSRERDGQTIWGWRVAAYLFLAGVGAGAYAVGAAVDFMGTGWDVTSRTGVTLGPLLVLSSTVFLIADLGAPEGFLRAGARPRSSWISRGVAILTAFIAIGLVNILLGTWPWHVLEGARTARLVLEGAGLIFALLTMVYTGLLLGAARPIPLWNNAMLPLLFLLSALSTGIMALLLILSLSSLITAVSLHAELSGLARADAVILALESAVVLFYLQGCYSSLTSRPSAGLLLTGALAPLFWPGFVAAGLAVPLTFELAQSSLHYGASLETEAGFAMASAIPGLAGGLLLRYLIVAGGVKVPLKVAGMVVNTSGKARF